MLTVTLHRASVADTGSIVDVGGTGGRGVARQTREHTLAEGSEIFRAVFDTLCGC